MNWLKKHVNAHKAIYFLLPTVVFFIVIAIKSVYWLTGRASDEDPSMVVAVLYNMFVAVFAIALTAFTKNFPLLNRPVEIQNGESKKPACEVTEAERLLISGTHELWASRLSTIALIIIYAYILKH